MRRASGYRPTTNDLLGAGKVEPWASSATELAEAPVGAGEAPEGKKLAGRSPTQIAFDRLSKDKIAIVCTVIVGAHGAGRRASRRWICKVLNIYPTAETMPYQPSDVLDFNTGLPINGPPNHGFWAGPPARVSPRQTGVDNLARLLYGLRTVAADRDDRHGAAASASASSSA